LSKLCENVVGIKTDCVIYTGKFKGNYGTKPGQYRKEDVHHFNYNMKELEQKTETIKPEIYKWNVQECWYNKKFNKTNSYALLGRGGVGKSYVLREEKGKRIAPTNTSANKINGTTIHQWMKLSVDAQKIRTTNNLNNEEINVDETSMISPKLWAIFINIKLNNPGIKMRFSGDFNQIQFIPELSEYERELRNYPRIEDCSFFAWLCDYNKVILNKSYRADKELDAVLRTRKNYETICGDHKLSDINVCHTNEKRMSLNISCNKRNKNKVIGQITLSETMKKREIKDDIYKDIEITEQYDINLKENTPWYSKQNNKKLNILKNEFYTLTMNDKKEYVMTAGIKGIEQIGENVVIFKNAEEINKYFSLAYAMTIFKLQGATITEPYIIHEWNHFYNDKYIRYTACSRAKRARQYNNIWKQNENLG
jgi:hypothetical protein